ncbi:hypothetical protein GCM10020254_88160 [Streptomyces goshikiensis]
MSVSVARPPAVVTVTGTTPGPVAGGTAAVICWSEMIRGGASRVPNSTALAVASFEPLMVTVLRPAVGPAAGGEEAALPLG